MLEEEGLENVFARHKRHSAATRAAAKTWGLDTRSAQDPHALFAGADRGDGARRP